MPDKNARARKFNDEAGCCGVVEKSVQKSMERRERRRERKQPWVVLKMTIVLLLGIIGYANYVYIGRLCVPMIRHDSGALPGGRGTGSKLYSAFGVSAGEVLNCASGSCVLGYILHFGVDDVVGIRYGM